LWGLLTVILYIPVILLAIFVLVVLTILLSVVTLGAITGTVISLGGLSIAGFTAVFSFVLGLVTKAIVAYLVGRWILGRLSAATLEGSWGNVWSLVIGVFLYEVLRAIPLGLGWLISVAVVLIGTGAIVTLLYQGWRKPAPVEAA
jgi:hypothetical protein